MADIWDVMKGVHVPGPNALYVGINGNDANPGTSGSRKRTIEAALNAMPAGGGIIYVGDGDYGSIGLYGRSFSNNAWCLVKSENLWGAKASGGITVSGQCVGIYGFETPQNAIGCAAGAYLAVSRCYVNDTGGAGIYAAGNNSDISNISWCYNLVHDTGWGDAEFAQSNMTAYEFKNNVGSQGHNWVNGYDNLIIGNICHSGECLAGGDGNGARAGADNIADDGGRDGKRRPGRVPGLCVHADVGQDDAELALQHLVRGGVAVEYGRDAHTGRDRRRAEYGRAGVGRLRRRRQQHGRAVRWPHRQTLVWP